MGIPQGESFSKVGMYVPNPQTNKSKVVLLSKEDTQEPPEIPPRMSKKGPELPEKPPHLRLAALTHSNNKVHPVPSSQSPGINKDLSESKKSYSSTNVPATPKNSQQLFLYNVRKKAAGSDREILVAATKGARDRPVEKRQREPAKLLTPTTGLSEDITKESLPALLGLASPKHIQRQSGYPASSMTIPESYQPSKISPRMNRAPVILIPRSHLSKNIHWNSHPVSYSVWVQNSGSGDPQVTSRLVKKAFNPNGGSCVELRPGYVVTSKGPKKTSYPLETKILVKKSSSVNRPRSSSVTRSGSLTSHGSTSSDSGNETFPKSVLKKHRKESTKNTSEVKKNVENKKNVTFNAFATVQLMEE